MRWFWLCSLLLISSPASAVLLRSGEHGEYTRLAFQQTGLTEWTVEQTENTVKIFFTPLPELDLSETFSRIGRDRIQSVDFQNDTLTLSLECNCEVEIARVGLDQIAIDVRPSDRGEGQDLGQNVLEEIDRGVRLSDFEKLQDGSLVARPKPGSADTPLLSTDMPPRIPLILEPLTSQLVPRVIRADEENLVGPRRPEGTEPGTERRNANVQIRDGRSFSTQLSDAEPFEAFAPYNECEDYAELEAILLADSTDILGTLPDLIESFDPQDPGTAKDLIHAYASIGLITEARAIANSNGVSGALTKLLYAASGENFGDVSIDLNPNCGAAAAILSLSSGGAVQTLPATLRDEILRLAQILPDRLRESILHRAVEGARKNALMEFAAELDAWTLERTEEDPTDKLPEYGLELVSELEAIESPLRPDGELLLASQSLVRELSDRDARSAIHTASLRAAAAQGDLKTTITHLDALAPAKQSEALNLVVEDILGTSSERAVVLATILAPLGAKIPVSGRKKLSTLLSESGFPDLANRWYRFPGETNEIASLTTVPPDLIVDLEDEPQAPVASDTEDQISALPPVGTFAGASARLDRSRDVVAQVARLLETAQTTTDP